LLRRLRSFIWSVGREKKTEDNAETPRCRRFAEMRREK
jgi:hypothetical protein